MKLATWGHLLSSLLFLKGNPLTAKGSVAFPRSFKPIVEVLEDRVTPTSLYLSNFINPRSVAEYNLAGVAINNDLIPSLYPAVMALDRNNHLFVTDDFNHTVA